MACWHRWFCICLALLAGLQLGSLTDARADDTPIAPRLSAVSLLRDAALLRQALETLHPGLYRYNNPASFDGQFRALQTSLARDQTLAEAYLALAEFVARLKCAQTQPNFARQPAGVRQAVLEAPRLPFYFRWLGERMVISRSFDAALPVGSQVLSLNGVPVGQILQALLPLARADGGNDAQRRADLEVQGRAQYEAFDVYWPLRFPHPDGELRLTVLKPGADQAQSLSVALQSAAARAAIRQAELVAATEPAWTLRFPASKVALLRMPSWALHDSRWDWRGFLQQSFSSLADRAVSDLVIDLRGNVGGLDEVGETLLGYLLDQALLRPSQLHKVRYQQVPEALLPYLDAVDQSVYGWSTLAKPDEQGLYVLLNGSGGEGLIPLQQPGFAGRLWLLVDASNGPAVFQFARQIRELHRGTLFGRPTGGNLRGGNGGAFFFLHLPATGIEIDIPLIGNYPATPQPDRGLLPDVTVSSSAQQIAAGRDAEWEMLRRWLAY